MSFRQEFTVFIQAAGQSSRMGADKSLLLVGGVRVIDRVLRAARLLTERIYLVSNRPEDYAAVAWRVVPDRNAGLGPLSGIRVALESSQTPWILNLGCDLPFVSGEFLLHLATYTTCCQAVVPLDQEGRSQPLCAFFHQSIADEVRALLKAGERRPRQVLDRVTTHYLGFPRYSHLPLADLFFFDMNTRLDYQEAQRIAEARGV